MGMTAEEISAALSNIQFGKERAAANYGREFLDWGRQRRFALPKAAAGFGSRGVVDSGIARRGLSDVAVATQTGYVDRRANFDDVVFSLVADQLGQEQGWADAQVMWQLDNWASGVEQDLIRNQRANQIRQATQ